MDAVRAHAVKPAAILSASNRCFRSSVRKPMISDISTNQTVEWTACEGVNIVSEDRIDKWYLACKYAVGSLNDGGGPQSQFATLNLLLQPISLDAPEKDAIAIV
jgi:hypothetical protein